MIVYPSFSQILRACDPDTGCPPVPTGGVNGIPVDNTIGVTIKNNFSQIDFGKSFNIQTITVDRGLPPIKQNDTSDKFSSTLTLDHPSFAHCFPQGNATAGRSINVEVEGLTPNSNTHGLLGPVPVFNGVTNSTGGMTIQFPIPPQARTGLNLITIGVDNTAFTAECEVNVKTAN